MFLPNQLRGCLCDVLVTSPMAFCTSQPSGATVVNVSDKLLASQATLAFQKVSGTTQTI